MAKINTTNYQPVTSWNGTQDLLIVEQPDGTKVATPEQVKQYVEAGDFEATGEIIDGHGNILKDMAKSADVNALMANELLATNITAYSSSDNQFTTPTDGYVRIELRNVNQGFYLYVNGTVLLGGDGHQVINAYDYMTVFVKKGVKLYYSGTIYAAIFFSLV